jgi:hypothetical protein
MAEESRRFPVARRTETLASLRSATEIDLGGVLSRNNPPSGARRRGSVRRRSQDLLVCHVGRIQKAVR